MRLLIFIYTFLAIADFTFGVKFLTTVRWTNLITLNDGAFLRNEAKDKVGDRPPQTYSPNRKLEIEPPRSNSSSNYGCYKSPFSVNGRSSTLVCGTILSTSVGRS